MHREVKARKKCGSRRKSVGTGKKGWCEQAVEQSTSSPKASFPGGPAEEGWLLAQDGGGPAAPASGGRRAS